MNDFSLAQWGPGTVATLTNVPWNSDYRDIVSFESPNTIDTYIDGRASTNVVIQEMSYARPGNPIRIPLPYGAAMKYNYVRVTNAAQPVPGSDSPTSWYYFITDLKHVAPNTTEIFVQLDVIQSFLPNVTMGRSYIEAGHIGIANENQLDDYGRAFLTVPEGFDLGGEYQVDYVKRRRVAKARDDVKNYQILILSTVDLLADYGTVSNPNLVTAPGSNVQGLPSGATLYKISSGFNADTVFSALSQYPWISQGIIGVWAFPATYNIPVSGATKHGIQKVDSSPSTVVNNSVTGSWRNQTWAIRHSRYRHLKKFLTYPYSFFELTPNNGAALVIKPESWQNDNGQIAEIPHWSPPNMRVMFMPKNYNKGLSGGAPDPDTGLMDGLPTDGEFLDFATGITDFPSLPLVNDGYLSVMASQAHSLQFANQSADWSQQKALQGNALASSQASASMSTERQQAAAQIAAANAQLSLTNDTAWQKTGVNAAAGILGGAASGAGLGPAGMIAGAGAGVGNAIVSGIATGIDVNARNQSQAISNSQTRRMLDLSQSNQAYMRDSNRQYADFAANGDYRMSIAAINAKVQDAKLTQPSVSGQMGGESFNMANFELGYIVKYKTLTDYAMVMIGEHWLRYGYAVNRYFNVQKRFHVMSHFTYWKMQECVITNANMPETFKQAIRGIFEKGVTVWKNPAHIGTLDPGTNQPIPGVSL